MSMLSLTMVALRTINSSVTMQFTAGLIRKVNKPQAFHETEACFDSEGLTPQRRTQEGSLLLYEANDVYEGKIHHENDTKYERHPAKVCKGIEDDEDP
jgi:hypothetical protein